MHFRSQDAESSFKFFEKKEKKVPLLVWEQFYIDSTSLRGTVFAGQFQYFNPQYDCGFNKHPQFEEELEFQQTGQLRVQSTGQIIQSLFIYNLVSNRLQIQPASVLSTYFRRFIPAIKADVVQVSYEFQSFTMVQELP